MEGFQEKRIRGENEFVAISGCMDILVSSKPAMGTKIGGVGTVWLGTTPTAAVV